MKRSRIIQWFLIMGATLSLVIAGGGLVTAAQEREPKPWPPPLTRIRDARPFSHPEQNMANPKSPLYNPNALWGSPGSRFDPFADSSVPPPNGSQHVFGTAVTTSATLDYIYAKHKYVSNLSLPSSPATLYAPTILGPNSSPLEIVTRYWWDGGTLRRHIAVYDFAWSPASFRFSWTPTSDYLDANGYYTAEVIEDNGLWQAAIYNYALQQWEYMYERIGGTGPDPKGWDMWEAWNFNESPWPDIASAIVAKDIYIYVQGSGGTYVTASYGGLIDSVHTAPYNFNWIDSHQYYHWSVNMDY